MSKDYNKNEIKKPQDNAVAKGYLQRFFDAIDIFNKSVEKDGKDKLISSDYSFEAVRSSEYVDDLIRKVFQRFSSVIVSYVPDLTSLSKTFYYSFPCADGSLNKSEENKFEKNFTTTAEYYLHTMVRYRDTFDTDGVADFRQISEQVKIKVDSSDGKDSYVYEYCEKGEFDNIFRNLKKDPDKNVEVSEEVFNKTNEKLKKIIEEINSEKGKRKIFEVILDNRNSALFKYVSGRREALFGARKKYGNNLPIGDNAYINCFHRTIFVKHNTEVRFNLEFKKDGVTVSKSISIVPEYYNKKELFDWKKQFISGENGSIQFLSDSVYEVTRTESDKGLYEIRRKSDPNDKKRAVKIEDDVEFAVVKLVDGGCELAAFTTNPKKLSALVAAGIPLAIKVVDKDGRTEFKRNEYGDSVLDNAMQKSRKDYLPDFYRVEDEHGNLIVAAWLSNWLAFFAFTKRRIPCCIKKDEKRFYRTWFSDLEGHELSDIPFDELFVITHGDAADSLALDYDVVLKKDGNKPKLVNSKIPLTMRIKEKGVYNVVNDYNATYNGLYDTLKWLSDKNGVSFELVEAWKAPAKKDESFKREIAFYIQKGDGYIKDAKRKDRLAVKADGLSDSDEIKQIVDKNGINKDSLFIAADIAVDDCDNKRYLKCDCVKCDEDGKLHWKGNVSFGHNVITEDDKGVLGYKKGTCLKKSINDKCFWTCPKCGITYFGNSRSLETIKERNDCFICRDYASQVDRSISDSFVVTGKQMQDIIFKCKKYFIRETKKAFAKSRKTGNWNYWSIKLSKDSVSGLLMTINDPEKHTYSFWVKVKDIFENKKNTNIINSSKLLHSRLYFCRWS